MAGATVHMTAIKQKTLQEVREQLLKIQCIEEVSATKQIINDVKICTAVFEMYYERTGSYTSATVVLTENGEEQTACIVASGGGAGLLNHSYGANRDFAKSCVKKLETCGFVVTDSDIEQKQNLLQRIFK
ncbi:MAG: hypothetical protein IKJ77_07395 [Firmicutes bacterium]|nr:hypothetical protein [Bacillota bacterium]